MNSGQMLLPQQLGLLQDERQDSARSEQSSELDCLGAVPTPCDHMDVGLRRAPGCPSEALRSLFLSARQGQGMTCPVSSLQTRVVPEAAWGTTAVTAEGLPDRGRSTALLSVFCCFCPSPAPDVRLRCRCSSGPDNTEVKQVGKAILTS